MKPQHWVPVAVFLGVSIPTILVLQALDWGGEFRLWIAILAGGAATGYAQSRLVRQARQEQEP